VEGLVATSPGRRLAQQLLVPALSEQRRIVAMLDQLMAPFHQLNVQLTELRAGGHR
jgi:hypothetical protein